jgi:hypothetical protein
LEKYAQYVKINGQALDVVAEKINLSEGSSIEYTLSHTIKNARVNIYRHGTVIIPQDTTSYSALTVYADKNYAGSSRNFKSNRRYYDLGEFDNKISSFKLRRGYMATFANEPDGKGFSRIFIADEEDIEIPVLQNELIGKASFIAVFDWQWPSKKGWCSSGRNAYNELDLTESTWWYSWSADRPPLVNQEYVPIKQNSGWPSGSAILATKNATHLLGFNEPDRPDQANATVETAIAGWPALMATGLRLGSPAIADNFTWLYNFMNECDKRNFRVDFVAIHAYWGGSGGAYNVLTDGKVDINKWYRKLKEVHDRTGRPLWITEWNNGANWTNNGEPYWDSDPVMQQLQNKEIMEKVLHMLDTCSFVERYSLYNWVSDRKAVVEGEVSQAQIDAAIKDGKTSPTQADLGKYIANGWINQRLTPTGYIYRDRYPGFAFNRSNEVIPSFSAAKPSLSATVNVVTKTVNISWIDYNGGELSESYTLERKIDEGEYIPIFTGTDTNINEYKDLLELKSSRDLYYRIGVKSITGTTLYSDEVRIGEIVASGTGDIRYGAALVHDLDKNYILFSQPFSEKPVVVFGGQSHENKTLRSTVAISLVDETKADFYISPWKYISSPSISKPETLPYIVAKKGNSQWGDLNTETGSVSNVNDTWKAVTFNQPFETIPVVFVTSPSIMSGIPVAARVRNVTKTGFEVRLTKEKAQTKTIRETVNYFAIVPGTTTVEDKKLSVGITEPAVGETSNALSIPFGSNFNDPVFYCGLQTSNDDVTVTLRYQSLTNESASVLKLKELSSGLFTTNLDQAGWMVIESPNSGTGIDPVVIDNKSSIYPTVTSAYLNVNAEIGLPIKIYTMTGMQVKSIINSGNPVDVSNLSEGMYIITVGGESLRFIKKK